MNKTFRSVWNASKQAYVAAAETVSARGKPSSGAKIAAVLTALLGGLLGSAVQAAPPTPPAANQLPTGGQVSAGNASISSSGANMVINQGTDRAAINWQTFNVGSNAQVQFNQPGTSSVALNRVLSSDPSQIFGRISANGQVILTNPSGVYFSPSARVDVGGLVATTHGIGDADFMAGNTRFERNGSTASVVNEGELKAALGGYIALLAPEVRNQGAVIAQMGTVAMASGEAIDLKFDSNNRLTSLRVTPSQIQALVDNQRAVQAPGGLVIISAQSLDRLAGGVVKNSGAIEATGLQSEGGRIILSASTKVNNSGTLDVSSASAQGGSVSLLGETIELQDGSRINASGATGGGQVYVGGGWQGGAIPLSSLRGLEDANTPSLRGLEEAAAIQATTVTMEQNATINASATDKGDGGKVVLWSDVHKPDSVTSAQGTVSAKGGAQGGNGGQVETSGHSVSIDGFRVDTRAASDALGKTGLWLIDPYDYNIYSAQAVTIGNALNSSDVTVTTAASNASYGATGSGAGRITFWSGQTPITKTAAGTTTLTLRADEGVWVASNITSTGGPLNVVLWSDNANANLAGSNIQANITTNGGHLWAGGSSSAGGSSTWNGLTVGNGPSVGSNGYNWYGMDLFGSINTNGGHVLLWAGWGKQSDMHGFGLNGNQSISTGSGDITLLGGQIYNAANNAILTVSTTGKLTLAHGSGSGWAADFNWIGNTSGSDFTLNNIGGSGQPLKVTGIATLSGLTLGRYEGMSGQTLSNTSANVYVNSAISIAGPISLYGNDVGVNANLTSTLVGAKILLKATNQVWTGWDRTFTTNNGDLVLWSDSDANNAGSIVTGRNNSFNTANGSTSSGLSGGGRIVMAGGSDSNSDGLPDGYAISSTMSGVRLGATEDSVTTMYSGGGDVTIRGKSTTSSGGQYYDRAGIYQWGQWQLNAGKGAITLEGNSSSFYGIKFVQPVSNVSTGAKHLELISDKASGSAISITGTSSASHGVVFDYSNPKEILATGGGDITITGTGTGSYYGIYLQNQDILASGGNITLNGGTLGIYVAAEGTRLGSRSGSAITSSSTNLTLRANKVVGAQNNVVDVSTTGSFTFEPFDAGWDSSIYGGRLDLAGTLSSDTYSGGSDTTWLHINNVSALTGLTLGKAGNSSGIATSTNWTINGPIRLYGKDITLSANLSSTANGAEVLLKASGGIAQASGVAVSTQGGDVTYWADSDGANGGYVWFQGGSVDTTTAANIVVSGGNVANIAALSNAGSYASGMSTTMGNGVTLDSVALYSRGGNITLRGKSATTNPAYNSADGSNMGNANGIRAHGSVTLDAGAGKLNLWGSAQSSTGSSNGIELSMLNTSSSVYKSASSAADAITLYGVASNAAADNAWGVYLWAYSSIQASNGGGISITGSGAKHSGVVVPAGASVLSTGGPITLTGTGYGAGYYAVDMAGVLGRKAGSAITSSSSNIDVVGDKINISGATSVGTSGTVTMEPYGNSFAAALNFANVTLGSSVSGLTLGKSTNTADITIGSATSIAGPITVYGGNITVNAGLTSTAAGQGILLKGTGNITVAASQSLLTNGGNIILWSDSDTSGAGGILINNNVTLDSRTNANRTASLTSTASGGGHIVLAGGYDDGGVASNTRALLSGAVAGDGLPDGFAISASAGTLTNYGIRLGTSSASGVKLYSGGGNVLLQGGVNADGASGWGTLGLIAHQGLTMDAGSNGNLTLLGVGNAVAQYVTGMDLQAWRDASGSTSTLRTANGNINIVALSMGATSASLALDAKAYNGSMPLVIAATGTGSVTLDAKATGASPSDMQLSAVQLLAASGAITVNGQNGGVQFANYPGANTVTLGSIGGGLVTSSSSSVTLSTNTLTFNAPVQINTSGSVTVAPYGNSFSNALTWPPSSGSYGLTLASTVSGLTIGKTTNTADITIGSATSIAGPITVYGGNITLNASLTSTASTGGNVTLAATGNIVGNTANVTLSTSGGNVLLTADTDGSNAGSIVLDRTSITTNGGNITLGGGNASGSGYAVGAAVGTLGSGFVADIADYRGIILSNASLNAGGGNITLRGKGSPTSRANVYTFGIDITSPYLWGNQGTTLSTTGNGSISLTGVGGGNADINTYTFGISLYSDSGGVHNISTGNGNITLNGTSGTGTASLFGGIVAGYGTATIVSSQGNIVLQGLTSNTADPGLYVRSGAILNLGGNGSTNTTGSVTISADRITNNSTLNFRNTGALTIEPYGTNFASAFTWLSSGFANIGSKTGLTLGKSSNTADITIGSATSIAGPITVYGGNVTLNAGLTSTATTGTGISITGARITQDAGVSVSTSGANISYTASGGAFTSGDDKAINIGATSGSRSTISAGGGNITLSGSWGTTGVAGATNGDFATWIFGADIQTTGAGTITITGDATNTTTTDKAVYGINLGAATLIQSENGAITLTGTGGKASGNSRGLVGDSHSFKVLSSSGDITLKDVQPTGLTGTYTGMYLTPSTSANIYLGSDGSTPLSGSSTASSSNITLQVDRVTFGLNNSFKTVASTSGALVVEPVGTSFSSAQTMNTSLLDITGTPSSVRLGKDGNTATIVVGSAITAVGPISIYGGNIYATQSLNTTAGSNAGDVLLKAAGDISLAAGKSITTSGGDVILWANSDGGTTGGSVLLRNSSSVSTSGGKLWIGGGSGTATWNGLTVGDGYAVSGTTITPIAGGSFTAGVYLERASLTTGGGNMAIFGKSNETGFNHGIVNLGATTINSGTGQILIDGQATGSLANVLAAGLVTGMHNSWGGNNSANLSITSAFADASKNAIEINAGVANTSSAAMVVEGTASLAATGGGKLKLTSVESDTGYDNARKGINLGWSTTSGGTLNLLSASGNILVQTNSSGISIENNLSSATLGAKASSAVTSSSSNITLTSDVVNAAGALAFNTSGQLTIEPVSGHSFTAAFDTAQLQYSGGVSGLTIGNSTNTANITIGSATTIAGPINIYGGNIAVNGATTATSSSITLNASGAVTQSAALTANTLALNGSGSFTLSNTGNSIGTLYGGSSGARLGSLSFTNASALTEGSGSNGLYAVGNIKLETLSGDLSLAGNIDTLATSASALVLNAGKSTAAGTSTGGDVKTSGSPTLGTGSGGRTTIYTGSLSGSTGVAESAANAGDGLVAYGSGRFRYNSNAGTTNYTAVLGNGAYVIYREQPSVTITPDDQTITYGESPALSTRIASNATTRNGDTLTQAAPNLPAATVYDASNTSTVAASANGTAYYDAGSYKLRTASPASSALGYALSSGSPGTLTVNKKAVTITANNDAKFYSQNDTAGYAGVSYTGLVTGESSISDGTRTLTRASGEAPNTYALTPSGVASNSNYSISYAAGTFTIAPVDQLLVRVGPTSAGYGTEASYTASSAKYVTAPNSVTVATADLTTAGVANFSVGNTVTLLNGSSATLTTATVLGIDSGTGKLTIQPQGSFAGVASVSNGSNAYSVTASNALAEIALTAVTATGGAQTALSYTDGASSSVHFNVDGVGARNGSGFFNVGSRSLAASNVQSSILGLSNGVAVVGNLNVTPKLLSLSATKVYDGNRAFAGSISTGVGSETLNYSNAQANDANVANATYFTAMTLSDGGHGGLASNYALPDMTQAGVNNVASVTRRPLALSGNSVYGGSTALGASAISFNAIANNASSGLVAGESLGVSAATGSDAHVATANNYINSLTLADASGLVGNYSIQGLSPTAGSALTTGLSAAADNSLNISARPVVVTVSNTNVSKVYDGSDSAKVGNGASANAAFTPQWAFSNVVAGDSLSLNPNYSARYNSANVASANAINLSSIAISGVTGTASSVVSDYTVNSTASVTASITARPVAVSGTGVSKVYDGTRDMNQVSIGFTGVSGQAESGVLSGQALTVSGGTGTFSSAGAGTGKSYSLSGFSLSAGSGTDASNYSLPGGGSSTLTGNDGVIYQRPLALTFTGDAKTYDGSTAATVSLSYANTAYAPVTLNNVTDDVTVNRSAVFDSKNVGSGASRVSVSAVSLSGVDAGNYTLSYSASNPLHSPTVGSNAGYNSTAAGEITRLSSATWVGASTGNWFDPANWAPSNNLSATGTVPDLANVATVVIPSGNSVAFNGTGSGLAVTNQPVSITGLQGSGATLNVSTGTLNVGNSGATLAGFAQSGGSVNGTGTFTVSDAFSQSAGTLATTGSSAHVSLNQATGALSWNSISSGGDLTATGTGAIALGSTTVGGNLSANSGNGAITQSGALAVTGSSTLNAGTGNVTLDNTSNDFGGAVSVTGTAVTLRDANALTAVLNTSGTTALTAGGDLALSGAVQGAGSNLTLDAAGKTAFGATNVGGNLSSTTHGAGAAGGVAQTGALVVGGTSSFIADTGTGQDAALTNATNDFGGAVSFTNANAGSWRNVAVTDVNALTLGTVTTTGNLVLNSSGALDLGTSTIGGTLSANSHNGNITQSGALAVVGTSTLNAGTGDVVLTNPANDFVGAVNVTAANASLTDANALTLGTVTTTGNLILNSSGALDLGTSTVGGTLNANSHNGNITQSGALTVTGSSTLNAGTGNVVLTNAGNDFTGAVSVTAANASLADANALTLGTVTTSGNLTLNSTGALDLGTSTVGGNLSASSGNGNITQSGALTVNGTSTLNAGTGDVTLNNAGNDFTGTVSVAAANASLTDANALTLGTVTTSGNLTLSSTGALDLGTSTVGGALSANSHNGNITQSGALTVAGTSTLNAGTGDVTLNNASNDFTGAVSVAAANASLTDANALTLGTVTTTGNLALNSTGALDLGTSTVGGTLSANSHNGNITQSGALAVTGTSNLNAGTGDVTLNNAGNDFVGAVSATAANASLTDANALTLGTVTTSGNLTLNSTGALDLGTSTVGGALSANSGNGNITQSGPLAVNGTSTLNAGTGNVTLNNAGNDFTGAVSATANNVGLTDVNALTLGTVTTTGNLALNSTGTLDLGTSTVGGALSANSHNGNITQSGALTVAGTSTLNAGTGNVTLNNAANDFTGAVNVSGNNVGITDANALTLGTVTTAGNLALNSTGALDLGTSTVGGALIASSGNGNITQSGPLAVNGTSTLNAGTGNVTLNNAANDFTGAINASGNNVGITDANALTLGTVTTSGNLTLNSTGALDLGTSTIGGTLSANSHNGNITQSGALTVAGTSTLNAGTGDVTLNNASNDFTGTVSVAGANASLTDANALTLGTVTTTGNLTLNSSGALDLGTSTIGGTLSANSHNGNITQSGPLTVAGTSTLNAGTGNVTLNNAGNDFTGAVNVSGNNVGITDANALTLGTVTTSGNLALNSTGALDLGTSTVGGNLSANSGNGNITQSGALAVTGSSTLNAGTGNVTLNNPANDFVGAVNATANNVGLTDANALTLGTVTTTGNLALNSTGALDLGTSTVGGTLNANSHNGNITQSGPLTVAGNSTLNAGTGNVVLTNAGNDFVGAVNVNGNNVGITDANALTLSTVTTAGNLALGSTGALDLGTSTVGGALSANSHNGNITQSGPLAVTGSSTLNAGTGNVVLTNAGNDFVGAVNVNGNNVGITDANAMTLGTVTTAGNLSATAGTDLALNGAVSAATLNLNATSGAIGQSAGSLTVSNGPSHLTAGGNILLAMANDFNGTVNASGANVTLSDSNSLVLGTVTASGNLALNSTGALGLGSSTVGGDVSINSGNGNITQSGPLVIGGYGRFDAGTGSALLSNAGNSFPNGTTIDAGTYAIAGDARRTAAQAAASVQGSVPSAASPGTGLSNAASPQALVLSSAPASSASSSSGSSSSSSAGGGTAGGGNSAGVTIDLSTAPAAGTSVMAAVSLPKGASTSGAGFSFTLPESIRAMVQDNAPTQVSLPNGAPLPGWLRFDAQLQRFDARAVPDGAFPMQVSMTIGGQRVMVVISERSE